MIVRTTVEFSGVPKGTTGKCVEEKNPFWTDKKVYKVIWNLKRKKPLVDWFDQFEFDKYLKVISKC